MEESQFVGRKSQLVVLNEVLNYAFCGLAVIFCGFISLLIGRETINILEIFSGVHGFNGKDCNCMASLLQPNRDKFSINLLGHTAADLVRFLTPDPSII